MKHRILPWCMALLLFAGCSSDTGGPVEPTSTPDFPPASTATPSPSAAYTPKPIPTPILFPTEGYCNAEGVNMRREPSTESEIVTVLGENEVVRVVALRGDWYQINYEGETAYLFKDLVDLGAPPREDNVRKAVIAVDAATLYISYDGEPAPDEPLVKGTPVRVLRTVGDYCHIVVGSLQRYVLASDLSYDAPLPTSTPA